jgi:hypothetical protein
VRDVWLGPGPSAGAGIGAPRARILSPGVEPVPFIKSETGRYLSTVLPSAVDERIARIDTQRPLGPSAALASDFEGLRKMLQLLADKPPLGDYPNWSRIARAGADAATHGDIKGVRRSCKDCHDAYKERYKKQFPKVPAHPREPDPSPFPLDLT